MQSVAIATAIAVLLSGCSPDGKDAQLLEGVNIVDVESGEIIPDRDIFIANGKITAIFPSGEEAGLPSRITKVPLRGRYVLPGLVDMHVHVDHSNVPMVFPAYGVTTVLNMRGDMSHLELRDGIATDARWRSSFYTAADYMEGWPQDFSFTVGFDGVDDLSAAVKRRKSDGYDFLKIYK